MSKFTTLVKTTLTPIALCLTLAIAVPAIAKKGHHQEHENMRKVLSELSLTDSQKQDIRQILKQTREDRGLFNTDAKSLRSVLGDLVQSTEWDQTAVESAITQHQVLRQEKALQRATNKNLVWNLLTETQQTELTVQLETRKAEGDEKHKEGKRKGKHNSYKLKRLDLTEAQQTAIEVIKDVSKASAKEIKMKLETYKQAERLLIHRTDFNPDVWQALSNEYQTDFLAMAVLQAKTKHDIWNQLTPEQQADAGEKMCSKKSKHRKKGKEHQNQKSV
jgi:protein CpxP